MVDGAEVADDRPREAVGPRRRYRALVPGRIDAAGHPVHEWMAGGALAMEQDRVRHHHVDTVDQLLLEGRRVRRCERPVDMALGAVVEREILSQRADEVVGQPRRGEDEEDPRACRSPSTRAAVAAVQGRAG